MSSGNVHRGHRDRLKERFIQHGLDSFDDHNVLELLLFHSIPRRDTNPIAHDLIDRFGSLADVFDAPLDELMKVDGVGEASAMLLKLLPQISRRYLISRSSKDTTLSSTRAAGEYITPYFHGERDEVVYIFCLDTKLKVIGSRMIHRGNVNSAAVNTRKLAETALSFNAVNVILAHNHPSGVPMPSDEDKQTTNDIRRALEALDINLMDHVVVADKSYYSFADHGLLKR